MKRLLAALSLALLVASMLAPVVEAGGKVFEPDPITTAFWIRADPGPIATGDEHEALAGRPVPCPARRVDARPRRRGRREGLLARPDHERFLDPGRPRPPRHRR